MESNVTKQHNNERPLVEDEMALDDTEPATADGDTDADTDLVDELETARAERDAYLDQLQRTAAEFANYRRRTDQERAQLVPVVRKDVVAQFLPVIDDFERALSLIPGDEQSKSWVAGLQMIDHKFRGILDRVDAKIIDPIGEPFDPSRHEGVASEPGSSNATVVEVYQKGYAIGDMLVRPAMVKTGDRVKTPDA
jgi:molecular chaperone GrpE